MPGLGKAPATTTFNKLTGLFRLADKRLEKLLDEGENASNLSLYSDEGELLLCCHASVDLDGLTLTG